MNVLVTGGAGFIGSHLVERLIQRGDTVTVVDNFNDFYSPQLKWANLKAVRPHIRLFEADITDSNALATVFAGARFDAIVHLAARAGVRPSLAQPKLYTEVNVGGTQNLLELARQHQVRKFVFASSSSVYGIRDKLPFSETASPLRPVSPYAATKLAGEALCHVYHHVYGLDVVCLRLFTVYGPRQRPDLAVHRFTAAVLAGQPIDLYGDGSSMRDYTYIDDVIQGMLAALDRPLGYEIINLGESQPVALTELIRLIEEACGCHAQIRRLPPQPGDVPVTCADIRKARRLLDYNPQTPIREGLRRFVEWYRLGMSCRATASSRLAC